MLRSTLLLLAGVFAGLWYGGNDAVVLRVGYAALSATALLLAIGAGGARSDDGRRRAEDAFVAWIAAWHRARTADPQDRVAALEALRSHDATVALLGSDRVVKSLRAAARQHYAPGAVATVVMDMRRTMRRAALSVRPIDIADLLAGPAMPASAPAAPAPLPGSGGGR